MTGRDPLWYRWRQTAELALVTLGFTVAGAVVLNLFGNALIPAGMVALVAAVPAIPCAAYWAATKGLADKHERRPTARRKPVARKRAGAKR